MGRIVGCNGCLQGESLTASAPHPVHTMQPARRQVDPSDALESRPPLGEEVAVVGLWLHGRRSTNYLSPWKRVVQLPEGDCGTNRLSLWWKEAPHKSSVPVERDPREYPHAFRRLPSLNDERVSLEARLRSHLAVNCAPCHCPGGIFGGGFFDARLETPTDFTGLLLRPLYGDFGRSVSRPVRRPGIAISPCRRINVPSSFGRGLVLLDRKRGSP